MRSGFPPQQRIDTPPAVEDRADPARLENGQEIEDAVGSHGSSLGAAERIGVQGPATALTGPDPADPVCRQAAVRVNSNELLLVCCNALLCGDLLAATLEVGPILTDERERACDGFSDVCGKVMFVQLFDSLQLRAELAE
jgi:hypothetical protein